MAISDAAASAARWLPRDIAVLCADCDAPVPLIMFVEDPWPKRLVRCPACACEVVLRDAW